uniref:Formamidopyrimidine-DNA glycosylase catalytic domain-containing protein n=1 Tax=Chromera velia CCMP2878 TaxID=1169474 RepID=A0A0G4FFS0_9ALVE|eukprot:Cvel_3273.t1-p1 / transcript=Cvel_3273.t1 / gene=Cvel_3273 / organism=Chromera_velia_CCMP2878 / gene_product=Formamidopyrimidine-DNA glycosylase, putative / transcript_product=Formamidopyrimidine-DNA glycosylase, putative / location=Cvel_scaffold128:111726-114234(-) / protein_length=496 / sequence_SO=supercontig / SO=protein_coding / is_pseudo=false
MPELPEVERARRLAEEFVVGKKIVECTAADDTIVIENVPPPTLEKALLNKTVVASKRKGKNAWWILDSPPHPTFHLGMAGSFRIKGGPTAHYKTQKRTDDDWPPRWCKLLVKMDDGTEFAFTDTRRFGRIRLLPDPENLPPISLLGFDPLLEMLSLDEFGVRLRGRSGTVKGVLLDQAFAAGIGNWIADEVLYQAAVHPATRVGALTDDEVAAVHGKLEEVIQVACATNADSAKFPESWLFHFRWEKGSSKGGAPKDFFGRTITFLTVATRTSAVVPSVQGSPRVGEKEKKEQKGKGKGKGKSKKPDTEDGNEAKEDGVETEGEEAPQGPQKEKAGGRKRKRPEEEGEADGLSQDANGASGGGRKKRGRKAAVPEAGEEETKADDEGDAQSSPGGKKRRKNPPTSPAGNGKRGKKKTAAVEEKETTDTTREVILVEDSPAPEKKKGKKKPEQHPARGKAKDATKVRKETKDKSQANEKQKERKAAKTKASKTAATE